MNVESFAESSKDRLAVVLPSFTGVGNARSLVTMGELAQFKGVHKIVLPSLNTEVHGDAK